MTSCQNHNQPTAQNLFLHYIFKTRSLQVPRSRTVTLKNLKVWKPDPLNLNSFIIAYDLVASSFHLNTLWKSWRLFQPYNIIAKKPFQWPADLESVSTIFHYKVSDYVFPFQKPTYCCRKEAEYCHQCFNFTSLGYLIYLAMDHTLWSWQWTERCLSLICSSSVNARSKLHWWGDHTAVFIPRKHKSCLVTDDRTPTLHSHWQSSVRPGPAAGWRSRSGCLSNSDSSQSTAPAKLQHRDYLTCWRGWVCPALLRMDYHGLFDTMHAS